MIKLNNMMMILMMISCNNWVSIWMLTEILLMSNIMLMNKMTMNKELLTKFLIINSINSSLIMMMIMINSNFLIMKISFIKLIMFINLWFKMNIFPFHWWMMTMSKFNNWMILFNMNFQLKIPTLIMMSTMNFLSMKMMIFMLTIPVISINLNNLMKIMIFMSINNSYWFIMIMNSNNLFFYSMFTIYMLTNLILYKMMSNIKLFFLNQFMKMYMKEKIILIVMIMNLFNLPPMTMFSMKWMMIKTMMVNNTMMFMLILMNIFMMFNYLKITIFPLMEFNLINKYTNKNKSYKPNYNNNMMMNFLVIMTMIN